MFYLYLTPFPHHPICVAIKNYLNRDGLLDLIKQLGACNATKITLLCQLFSNAPQVMKMKACLLLLVQHDLLDEATLRTLHWRADDFTFIYKTLVALANIQGGKLLTSANLNLILAGNTAVHLSELLPILQTIVFFSDSLFALLCRNIFHARQLQSTFQFLLKHNCLDKIIFTKLLLAHEGCAHHIEFVASLLLGCNLLTKANVVHIFSLRDDYYVHEELAKLAEEGVLTNLLFQQKSGGFIKPIPNLQRSQSWADLRFLKCLISLKKLRHPIHCVSHIK